MTDALDPDSLTGLDKIAHGPDTRAWCFAAIDHVGNVSTCAETHNDELELRSICAGVLVQHAAASEKDQTEFIRGVVQEYNSRKKTMAVDRISREDGGDG